MDERSLLLRPHPLVLLDLGERRERHRRRLARERRRRDAHRLERGEDRRRRRERAPAVAAGELQARRPARAAARRRRGLLLRLGPPQPAGVAERLGAVRARAPPASEGGAEGQLELVGGARREESRERGGRTRESRPCHSSGTSCPCWSSTRASPSRTTPCATAPTACCRACAAAP